MIRLKDVTKVYNLAGCETHALNGITMQIENGENIAVMGASGSGKSTLLNIIGGMDNLTGGEYYYDDIAVHTLKGEALHKFRKSHVSFVFQQFALMPHYTIFENVEIPLLAKGFSKKKRREMVMEILDMVGIANLEKKLPSNTSGGQQQRCAIARALASDNPLVLADEPTGALDSRTGAEIMDILHKVNEQGKTLVIITHDAGIAKESDRQIRIEDGRIAESL